MAARRHLPGRGEESRRPAPVDRGTAERKLNDAEKRLRSDPDDVGALQNASLALLDLGRLDEAREAVEKALTLQPADGESLRLRRKVLDAYLWRLVDEGDANWRGGGKPRGMKHPIKLTPGPSITELVHEGRR